MNNRIFIQNLEVECIVGILPWERETPQKILIDARAYFDFAGVVSSRSIRDTVDYIQVAKTIEKVAKEGQYKLLEAMAIDISDALFNHLPITSVELEIKKQSPPSSFQKGKIPHAKYFGLYYRRGRNQPLPQSQEEEYPEPPPQDKIYQNRVALITGSAKGLGKAFAQHLGSLGCNIAVHYRNSQKEALELVDWLKDRGVQGEAFQADLTSEQSIKSLAQNAVQTFGKIDFLINNVGAFTSKPLLSIPSEEFRHILETNILGTFLLSREIIPLMRKEKFGRIINIGQASAERIQAYQTETPYYISKTGVLILTKSMAHMEAANGITCNMISPGVMVNNTYFAPGLTEKIPMGRFAEFKDFLGALDFLLSRQADYITGTAIDVAGGYRL